MAKNNAHILHSCRVLTEKLKQLLRKSQHLICEVLSTFVFGGS